MTKRMSATDAKNRWGDLVKSVAVEGETVVIENRREPVIVVISPADFDEFQALRKERRHWEFRERLQKIEEAQWKLNSDLTEEEADALVQRAMEEDREEHRRQMRAAS